MSDHIDGPRSQADPSTDLIDLFAFISPTNPQRAVLIADVFPFAGEAALFSNVVDYSIVLRRIRVAGLGESASFKVDGPEIRFTFRFDVLKPATSSDRQCQSGVCKLPDGRTLPFVVNDEEGVSTEGDDVRVFAGLRSDPFYAGWVPGKELKSVPNFLQEDNALSMVVEFETDPFLNPCDGSLFGVIAETTPTGSPPNMPPRFDWVGRPEQTNFRLNFPVASGVPGAVDIRDLWNQETPFAISETHLPLFRERLTESFQLWDTHNGKVDWEPAALAANVNVFLDDFLLFDVAKPITDDSWLEIEKSTIDGRAYTTGGGRTVNANVIDILVTWLVNHDRGPFMQGGATGATQPGGMEFPYVRPPNRTVLSVVRSVDLAESPQIVWSLIGQFGGNWHPLIAHTEIVGTGIGQLRKIQTIDGMTIVERLADVDETARILKYTQVVGIPAAHYEGMMEVRPNGTGSTVIWRVNYRPQGQGDLIVRGFITALLTNGLESLKTRFKAL